MNQNIESSSVNETVIDLVIADLLQDLQINESTSSPRFGCHCADCK